MVTEGLFVDCSSCEDDMNTIRPSSSSISPKPSNGSIPVVKNVGRANSSSSDKENGAERPELLRSQSSELPLETPPASPRVQALQSGFNVSNKKDSSFRKTYDENDKKRAIPCENCSLTLPKKTKEDSEAHNKVDTSRPVLRTRKPYERVARLVPIEGPSPPKSTSSNSSSDSDTAMITHARRHSRSNSRTMNRVGTSSSESSFTSRISHTHYVDYTSTHDPLLPTSFSIIRQSCLRTLSCETLPPSSNQPMTSTPTSPLISSPASSSSSTSSGGPIFFGDPVAGYTTAYIFRIPDPNARGRRRVYALMALSPHREWVAMQAFSFLSTAFTQLAAWIQRLAEEELERSESASSPRNTEDKSFPTPTSSFLSGRSRASDGKFAGMSLKSKGLAELVGMPDFFIELHTKFVRLLIELSLLTGS